MAETCAHHDLDGPIDGKWFCNRCGTEVKPYLRNRRHRTKPWPWPADTREDRAKRVALSYRALILDITQGRCTDPAGDLHRLDWHWSEYGITWTTPTQAPLDPDEWMTAADLAIAINRPRKDIYNWAARGHIEQRCGPDGAPEYLVESVIAYQRKLHARRTPKPRQNGK